MKYLAFVPKIIFPQIQFGEEKLYLIKMGMEEAIIYEKIDIF